MRFGKLFFVITLLAAISMAVLMVGCSKDSTTSSVSDNGYSTVAAEFGHNTDSLVAQVGASVAVFHRLDALDSSVVVAYSPVNPDSAVTYNGWTVIYATDLVAGYSFYLIDSLQFKAGGVVRSMATGSDQMQVIRHWGVENPDTTVSYRNADVISNFTFSGLNGSTVTINGTRNTTLNTKVVATNAVKRNYVINMVASSITMPKIGPYCPQTGTVVGSIVQTVDNGSVPVTTSWQYDVSIDAGTMTGEVTAGAWQASVTRTLCQ